MKLLLRISAVLLATATSVYVIVLSIGNALTWTKPIVDFGESRPWTVVVSTIAVAGVAVLSFSDRLLLGHLPLHRRRRRATAAAQDALNLI